MSDLQLLLLVLLALYGWECACWLRRGSVAFTTWLGRSWQAAHPGALLGNQRGGFIFAAPLPPLGTLLMANQFPLSLSPETALAFVATNVNPGWRPAQSGRWLALDAVREARAAGKKVVINGEVWLTTPSPGFARFVAGNFLRIAKLELKQRERAIRGLMVASLDTEAIKERWQVFRTESHPLRWLGNGLFVYLFAVVPAVLGSVGLGMSWLWLLLGLLALMVTTAAFFRRAHRVLYPESGDERFTHTLTIALSPASAMRAHDILSRPLLETCHPLAVASVFLPQADFRKFARRLLLELRHPAQPVCPSDDPGARAAESFSRRLLREAVEDMLQRIGLQPDDLCRPPKPADVSCRAYCPRCGAQFTTPAGECADCGGLALMAFDSAAR